MIGKRAVLIFLLAAALALEGCGRGPDSAEPEPAGTPPAVGAQAGEPDAGERENTRNAYGAVLYSVYYDHMLPDGQVLDKTDIYGMEDNFFAVCDVDLDGRDELIIEYNTSYMAGMTEVIYGYDRETGWVREQFMQFPSLTYYDNGIIQANFSHNQGLAGRFWPYFLYEYDASQDKYECVAMADAWDGSVFGQDYNGKPFPAEVDVSGEGMVYYLLNGDDYTLGEPVDKTEYDSWRSAYIGEANAMDLPKVPLTPENIAEGAAGTSALWLAQDRRAERNFYAAATGLSKAQVERFALEVRRSILDKDWQALAQCTSFPVTVNGEEYHDAEALMAIAPELLTGEDFVSALVAETCEEMFCKYQGISMADGRVWLADVVAAGESEGELYVIAVNTAP